MGIAKSAETPITQTPPEHTDLTPVMNFNEDSAVPFEMFNYFSVNPVDADVHTIKELKEIHKWSSQNNAGTGTKGLEVRMGFETP